MENCTTPDCSPSARNDLHLSRSDFRSRKSVTFSSDRKDDFSSPHDEYPPSPRMREGEPLHEHSNGFLQHCMPMHKMRNTSESSSDDDESGDFSTCSESWEESWSAVNEQKVTEITLNFFYQPRTLTLLLVIVISLVCVAFYRDDVSDRYANTSVGFYALCFVFLSISLLVFPNGPYTRPHPAVWRLVFGVSVLYLLILSFTLFQSYSDIRLFLQWIDHNLNESATDSSVVYSDNCSISWENMYSRFDIFVPAHFVGWMFKALLIRHTGILWSISIMWEVTEIFFAHVLPNFSECWWDIFLFDILLGNGLGIYAGMFLCRKLEVREFYWQSIKNIKGTKGKLKRAVLQFTPQDWSKIRWLDPSSTQMRTLAIFVLVLLFQITELNTFLLKHVFLIPTNHSLTYGRLVVILLIAAPSVRQYYVYATDKTCKRLGTQAWVYAAIMITELLISIRFLMPRPALLTLISWLVVVALLSILLVFLITNTQSKRDLFGWFRWSVTVVVPVTSPPNKMVKRRKGVKQNGHLK